jgi:hypothetical protein
MMLMMMLQRFAAQCYLSHLDRIKWLSITEKRVEGNSGKRNFLSVANNS